MASGGVGKIKTKKSKDAGKPYDRPQSLFQRVGSTLRSLTLKDVVPSFLHDSLWLTNNDDEENQEAVAETETNDTDCAGETSNNPQIVGASDVADSSVVATKDGLVVQYGGFQALFSHSSLAEEGNPTSSEGSSTSRPPLPPLPTVDRTFAAPFPNALPLTSRGATVSTGPSSAYYGSSSKRSAPLSCEEDDLLADMTEALSADIGGAPAKKRCVEKNNVRTAIPQDTCRPNKVSVDIGKAAGGEKSFLWQTKSNPVSASRSHSKLRSSPAATGKKPGFDLATFCTTINHSEYGSRDSSVLNTSQRQSPFYMGRTTYGGASSRPRTMNFDPDYLVMPTVRHEPRKVNVVINEANERQLSQTAKLILQGMDKTEQLNNATASAFDTGLSDSLLSFTPRTYKRNSLQASSSRTQPKTGPPVREQATPTFTAIQRSINAYRENPQSDIRTGGTTGNADRDIGRTSSNAPATYDLPSVAPSTNAPGKMRREPTRKHYTNRATEIENETPMTVDLPSIKLPVTNLQPFPINVLPTSSGAFFAGPPRGAAEPMDTATFTFSEPIATKVDSKPAEDAQQKSASFHFRSPIAVADHRSNGVTASPQQPPGPSSTMVTSGPPVRSSLAFSFNVNAAVKKAQLTHEPPSGGFAPASELKRGSVMDLLGGPSSSPASKATPATSTPFTSSTPATKPVAPAAGIVTDQRPLSELFKTPSNKWSCPECNVQNDNSLVKCPCCGEGKPAAKPAVGPNPATSGFPAQASVPLPSKPITNPLSELFKPSGDTWICPTCDVKNANRLDSCPCCTTARPSASKTHNVSSAKSGSAMSVEEATEIIVAPNTSNLPSLSSLFQKPPGDWVCPSCSVPNKEHQLQCCACEEPKPGAKPVPSNGAVPLASQTGSNGGQMESQGFKCNPAAFGSIPGAQPVFKAPDGTGIAQGGGFRMAISPGGFSGFGTGFAAVNKPDSAPFSGGFNPTGFTPPQPTVDKPESASFLGGFKPTGFTAPQFDVNKPESTPLLGEFKPTGFTAPKPAVDKPDSVPFSGAVKPAAFACFSQMPKNDTNGPATKPEILSFLPPEKPTNDEGSAVKSSFSGTFRSSEPKPSGFGFKPSDASAADVIAKPGGFTFGSTSANSLAPALGSNFQFGVMPCGEKDDEKVSTSMQRPPLRPEKDNDNGNCNIGKVDIGSWGEKNRGAPVERSESTVVAVGSEPSIGSTTSSVFGASIPVSSSSSLLFGQAKPTADNSASKVDFTAAPKCDFSAAPGSTSAPLAAFGAPSFPAIGATQPVFSAPSSITSAAIAPPVSAPSGLFSQPTIPDKSTGQVAAKPNPFSFGVKTSEAVPLLFKFGESQPRKEEAKPAPANTYPFGQQPQNPAPAGVFQFGAGSNNAAAGAGIFNATASQPPAPVFGQPPATAPGIFNFGAGTNNAQSNPASVFTFGAKPSDGVLKPDVTPSFSQLGGKRPMNDDGAGSKRGRSGSEDMTMQDVEPMRTPKQPSVGFAFNAPPTGFGFGAPQTSTPVNNLGLFGGKPANHVSGPSPFAFTGQQSAAPAPSAFGSQGVSNLANGSANTGFSFAASAAAPPSFNFGMAPSFNFAAAPAPSNPSGNNPFNAPPSGPAPPGRTIKKAVRRSAFRKQ